MVATAPEVARHLADALEAASIPYAIGGALALSVWGFPRATNDVDLDIFVSLEALDHALEVLRQAGCLFDRTGVLSSAASRGDFAVRYDGMRVDIFIPSIPVYASAQQRIRTAPLLGRQAFYLAPEDLAIFKMLFFRTKDILDIERLLAFGAEHFDRKYVRGWLLDLVGGDDDRIARWDRIVEDVDASLSVDSGESGA